MVFLTRSFHLSELTEDRLILILNFFIRCQDSICIDLGIHYWKELINRKPSKREHEKLKLKGITKFLLLSSFCLGNIARGDEIIQSDYFEQNFTQKEKKECWGEVSKFLFVKNKFSGRSVSLISKEVEFFLVHFDEIRMSPCPDLFLLLAKASKAFFYLSINSMDISIYYLSDMFEEKIFQNMPVWREAWIGFIKGMVELLERVQAKKSEFLKSNNESKFFHFKDKEEMVFNMTLENYHQFLELAQIHIQVKTLIYSHLKKFSEVYPPTLELETLPLTKDFYDLFHRFCLVEPMEFTFSNTKKIDGFKFSFIDMGVYIDIAQQFPFQDILALFSQFLKGSGFQSLRCAFVFYLFHNHIVKEDPEKIAKEISEALIPITKKSIEVYSLRGFMIWIHLSDIVFTMTKSLWDPQEEPLSKAHQRGRQLILWNYFDVLKELFSDFHLFCPELLEKLIYNLFYVSQYLLENDLIDERRKDHDFFLTLIPCWRALIPVLPLSEDSIEFALQNMYHLSRFKLEEGLLAILNKAFSILIERVKAFQDDKLFLKTQEMVFCLVNDPTSNSLQVRFLKEVMNSSVKEENLDKEREKSDD